MIKPIHLIWPAKCHMVTDELLSTYIFIGKKIPKWILFGKTVIYISRMYLLFYIF